jgi:GT2 family glycosyltransferase
VAVVLVCRDHAAALPGTLAALEDQVSTEDEVVVVDNASQDGTPGAARAVAPWARVVETGANLGFAGGCNVGVGASAAPLILLLNPDTVPAPGCLDALRACAAAQPAWGAWQALVMLEGSERVNSAGNHVHFLGFGWAGGLDEPVVTVGTQRREVAFASGAAMLVRREAWEAVGGFDDRYFMYGEDLDLCLRLRLAGWSVGLEPAARVVHDYMFTRGRYKWFYLERNRWWTIVGTYPSRLLLLLLPAMLAFEVGLVVAAWRQGWLSAKLRAQAAVARELPAMFARRRRVQLTRRISAREFAIHLTATLDSPNLPSSPILEAAMRLFWRIVRAAL